MKPQNATVGMTPATTAGFYPVAFPRVSADDLSFWGVERRFRFTRERACNANLGRSSMIGPFT